MSDPEFDRPEDKYAVITKTLGEAGREPTNAHLPDKWPAFTEEFRTFDEAAVKYPDRKIFRADHLNFYLDGVREAESLLKQYKKPFWKFWGK